MSRYALLASLALASVSSVMGQLDPAVSQPLAEKRIPYEQIPYKVDNDEGTRRGPQLGYNKCNSTTEGPDSLCQTSFVNSIDDFCLWAPSKPNSIIADTEGEEVAWCTKPGRGTRVIPPQALLGVQFMKTPDYVQAVGFIDQTKINIQGDDYGGELDPHGADLRGNPLGGLMYSNAFPSNGGNNNSYQQVIEWHNFMGGSAFCIKVCDPAGKNDASLCQHIYDRIGCAYNAPNNAQKGVFEVCEGENQDPPGIYTSNGAVMTYTQPPEELGAISTMPYTARIPASSNCVTYTSASLYASAASAYGVDPTATASASGSGKASGTGASSTKSGSAAGATGTSGSAALGVSAFAGVMGVAVAMVFLS